MAESLLRVHLFGAFSLSNGDESAALSPRLQSLLAYLLIHRAKPQTRQQIAFLFWPETSDAQAQTNLRQLLHTLKRRFPNPEAYLRVDERTVGWRADAAYSLDVAIFENALGRAALAQGPAKITALEQAVAAYAGDLMPGCYDDWILPVRERLAQAYVGALEQLVLLHEERRNHAQAIAHAQQLLRYDPLHEATYRRLMRLYALTGDRAAALRVYHTCASVLERELDVAPSPATQEAYDQLLRVETAPAHPQSHTARTPFVGRQSEWLTLQSLWRTVNRGSLRVVCVQGEAGLGKTRLAEEWQHWAQQQGIRTLRSQAYAAEGGLAYAPLVEWLRSEILQPDLARLAPIWRSELARLLPELLAADPGLPVPEPLIELGQRQRLFEAIGRAIILENHPLILVLDDLQWCDEESLAWLHYLIHHFAQARLLVIATQRDDLLAHGHPVAVFLDELHRLDLLTPLALAPLTTEETTTLAEAMAEQKLDPAQARQIFAATEGNPLFVVESMRAQLSSPGAASSPLALPPRVHAVIQARLAQLSPPSRDLAGLAAAIGRAFTADLLSAACEHDEETVVRSLDELWQRRIVREQGVAGYEFSHDRLREVAYGILQPARRHLLHRRLAQALERLHPGAPGPISAQLAYQCEQGGLAEQAIHYLQQAAGVARQIYSYREAIAYMDRAINLVRTRPADPSSLERELDLQMALCEDWGTATNFLGAEAKAAYDRALFLCRQLKSTSLLFTVHWGLHEIAVYRGDHAESLELARDCLRMAEELGDGDLLMQAHHAMWAPNFFLGNYAHCLAHAEAGLARYRHPEHEALSPHYGWHDAACCGLGTSAMALWQMGLIDQAAQRCQALLDHAKGLAEPFNRADGYGGVAGLYHLLRAPDLARPYADMTLRTGVERGFPGLRVAGAIPLGWSLTLLGKPGVGLALIEQAIDDDQAQGGRLHQCWHFGMLAEAFLAAGRPHDAITAVERGMDAFTRTGDLFYAPDLWTLKGDALTALGRDDGDVAESYTSALALAQRLGAKVSELRAATQLARLYQRQGRPEAGVETLRAVYDGFSEGFGTPDLLAAKAVLGELAVDASE
ncbi:MAG: AAA family ATPase [Caldilineaceae bacterium]|nr:AAA family ATPase [Caldilineaceae bacterium]MBP8122815.1 AAA family ATPase [Caldilineaceae bacterium]MBP9072086.1 AAA family ATPase [Caldilineaceae bacterium]